MRPSDATTLSEALRVSTERLTAAGVDAARSDAERLAAHALRIGWGALWPRLREPLSDEERQGFTAVIDRRAAGEPLAYIVGTTVFYGHEIACGPGALVPRPETETLVAAALALIDGIEAPVVAEIGTGTGAVAIAIAAARSRADVWATDTSTQALAWAKRNIDARPVEINLCAGDLFHPLPADMRGGIDLIVSNPPYIADGTPLPMDVQREPKRALFAGVDGNDVLLRLVREAATWLRVRGAIALEIGTPDQAKLIADELREWSDVTIHEDHTSRPRVVTARR